MLNPLGEYATKMSILIFGFIIYGTRGFVLREEKDAILGEVVS